MEGKGKGEEESLPPMVLYSPAECNLLPNLRTDWLGESDLGEVSLHCTHTPAS